MGAQNIAALPQNLPVLPPPLVNDRSPIVSSELDAAHPCVTISVYKKPTKSLFFLRIIMITIKIQKQPKGESLWQSPNNQSVFYSTVQNNEVFPWTLSSTWHDRIHLFKNRFAFEIIINSTIGPPCANSTTEQSDQCILRPTLNWVNY